MITTDVWSQWRVTTSGSELTSSQTLHQCPNQTSALSAHTNVWNIFNLSQYLPFIHVCLPHLTSVTEESESHYNHKADCIFLLLCYKCKVLVHIQINMHLKRPLCVCARRGWVDASADDDGVGHGKKAAWLDRGRGATGDLRSRETSASSQRCLFKLPI